MIDDPIIECDAIELKKKTTRRRSFFRNGRKGGTPITRVVGINNMKDDRDESGFSISDISSLGDFTKDKKKMCRSRGSLHSETTMQKANGISRCRQLKQRLLDLMDDTRDDDNKSLEWESVNTSSSIGEEEGEEVVEFDEENIHCIIRSEEDNDSEEEDGSRDSVFSTTEISSTSEGIEVNSNNDSSVCSLEEEDDNVVKKEISTKKTSGEVHDLGHMKIVIDQIDNDSCDDVSAMKDDSDTDEDDNVLSDANSSVGVESVIIDDPNDQERLKVRSGSGTRNDDNDDASSYALPWLAVPNKPTGNDHRKQSKKKTKKKSISSLFDQEDDEKELQSSEGNQAKDIREVLEDDDESYCCPNLVEASSNSSDECSSGVVSYSSTSSSSSIDLMMQALATASEKKVADREASELKPKRSQSSSVVSLLSVPSGCSHPFSDDSLDLVAEDDDDDDGTNDCCYGKGKDDDEDEQEEAQSVRYYIPTQNQSNDDDEISNEALFFSSGALSQEPMEYSLNEYVTTCKEDSQIQRTTSSWSIKKGLRRRSEGGKSLLSIFPHRSTSSTSSTCSTSTKSSRNRLGFTISRKKTDESKLDSELEVLLRKYFKGLELMERPPSSQEEEPDDVYHKIIVRESSTTSSSKTNLKKQKIPEEPEQEPDLNKRRSFIQTRSKTNRSNKTTKTQDLVEPQSDLHEYFKEAGLEVTEIRT